MGGSRTNSPAIIGIEIGCTVGRAVRVLPERNEIVAVAEVPLAGQSTDRDGVVEPAMVGPAIETLLARLGVQDRSQPRIGMTIGPRNAGVGSGPAMATWLESQSNQLRQPLVCSGGLGVAFAPIRAVDQAVKTSFEIGIELTRLDLAPVAAVRAVGEQIDDLICVGSGRGWQARMRDFEVLEAMENTGMGVDEPVRVVGHDGLPRPIGRYGWIDLSMDLVRGGRVDVARFATAVGAALGVLYESPANLLEGKVVGNRADSGRPEVPVLRPVDQHRPIRPEQTLQLRAAHLPVATATGEIVRPPGHAEARVVASVAQRSVGAPGPARSVAVTSGGASARPTGSASVGAVSGVAGGVAAADEQGWDDDHIAADDPINLFSPDTDAAHILGKGRFRLGVVQIVILLAVLAAGLAALYLFG